MRRRRPMMSAVTIDANMLHILSSRLTRLPRGSLPSALARGATCLLVTFSMTAACAPSGLRGTADERIAFLERETYTFIERERKAEGLGPLERSPALDVEARQHSERMAKGRVRFSHRGAVDRVRRLRKALPVGAVAENIANNKGYEQRSAAAVEGWLLSRDHRRNLLGDYDLTGIGISESDDGTLYFTQLFAKKLP